MDVVGFGALNFDRLYRVPRIISGDDEVYIEDEHASCGGSAANTVYGLGKLGVKCGFLGAVGDDTEGKEIIADLDTVGVDTSMISVVEGAASGKILGFVDTAGERALYAYPAANDRLEMPGGMAEYLADARILHMTSFVGHGPFGLQKELAASLEGSDVGVSFSPGALYSKRGLNELVPIISRSRVLFLNREECEVLTGKEYREGAGLLRDTGCGQVVVTLGADGCYVLGKGRGIQVGAYPTEVVDTTGAGDAFCAGFLAGLLQGMSPSLCGRMGNAAASFAIRTLGARPGLPTRQQLDAFMRDTDHPVNGL